MFSEPDRDPRGRVISHGFVSVISEEALTAVGGDDAAEACWFDFAFGYTGDVLTLTFTHDDIALRAELQRTAYRFGTAEYRIIDSGGLSFDHAKIIAAALDSLRSRVDDFDVIFDFLPEKFTLAQLQRVQEVILGTALLPANFRRKAAPYIEETQEISGGAGHRPAKLFRRKQQTEVSP